MPLRISPEEIEMLHRKAGGIAEKSLKNQEPIDAKSPEARRIIEKVSQLRGNNGAVFACHESGSEKREGKGQDGQHG